MKYLKYFEKTNEPQLYDYVIINGDYVTGVPPSFNKFLNENVGRIIKIDEVTMVSNRKNPYYLDTENIATIKYENFPSEIRLWFDRLDNDAIIRNIPITEIIHFSNNIEDLKVKIKAKKYNII